jgi:hypothetical protein
MSFALAQATLSACGPSETITVWPDLTNPAQALFDRSLDSIEPSTARRRNPRASGLAPFLAIDTRLTPPLQPSTCEPRKWADRRQS